ncbi:MAG: hypothetical protein ACYTG3_19595 [Planctomycetota bacterium]
MRWVARRIAVMSDMVEPPHADRVGPSVDVHVHGPNDPGHGQGRE